MLPGPVDLAIGVVTLLGVMIVEIHTKGLDLMDVLVVMIISGLDALNLLLVHVLPWAAMYGSWLISLSNAIFSCFASTRSFISPIKLAKTSWST